MFIQDMPQCVGSPNECHPDGNNRSRHTKVFDGEPHPSIIDSLTGSVKLERMPKFSIKDLLKATTLVAVGVILPTWDRHLNVEGLYGIGCALIGAGLLTPFKRPGAGACVGLIVACVVGILFGF
jgi:hypothetical protein